MKGQDEEAMREYLSPLLEAAGVYLRSIDVARTPIYLLATGGMRSIPVEDRRPILNMAYRVINTSKTFNVGDPRITVRTITGEREGLYAWVALNYAKRSTDYAGLTEMGGASTQFAFALGAARADTIPVCFPGKARKGVKVHNVSSSTWDGYGADTMRASLLQLLSKRTQRTKGYPMVLDNPCLPKGAKGKPLGKVKRASVGTGDFDGCLRLAKVLLAKDAESPNGKPIPSYSDIPTEMEIFGLSTYRYTFEFFSEFGYNAKESYNPAQFIAAVKKHCDKLGQKPDKPDSIFADTRCFSAAWMYTLLHDEVNGFKLPKSDAPLGSLNFNDPVESWTKGVAALVAEHGELTPCRGQLSELAFAQSDLNTIHAIVAPTAYPMSNLTQIESSTQATGELGSQSLSLTFVSGLGCGVVMVALLLFGYRSIRSRFDSGKVRLPLDAEDGYNGEGKKEYKGLMDVKHGL